MQDFELQNEKNEISGDSPPPENTNQEDSDKTEKDLDSKTVPYRRFKEVIDEKNILREEVKKLQKELEQYKQKINRDEDESEEDIDSLTEINYWDDWSERGEGEDEEEFLTKKEFQKFLQTVKQEKAMLYVQNKIDEAMRKYPELNRDVLEASLIKNPKLISPESWDDFIEEQVNKVKEYKKKIIDEYLEQKKQQPVTLGGGSQEHPKKPEEIKSLGQAHQVAIQYLKTKLGGG